MTKKAFTLAEVFSTHCADKRRNAFTLAEVLITLGIIGVVAAMTMPTLLNSTQGAQYRTAYKKALSVLSQAVVLNIALDDYDLSQATDTAAETQKSETSASLYNLFNSRMNVAKVCDGSTDCDADTANGWKSDVEDVVFGGNAANNYTFFFNDGITITFPKLAGNCTLDKSTGKPSNDKCYGVIDVNGKKNPNKVIADSENPTDIYPIMFYDQTIAPATEKGKEVMYGGK